MNPWHDPKSLATPIWTTEWYSRDAFALRVESTPGLRHKIHRVVAGTGTGAVVICRAGELTLWVRQKRRAPGVLLWELPRGFADANDSSLQEAGVRELAEETGLVADSVELIGSIYPDTGLLATRVGVVLVTVAEWRNLGRGDGEVDGAVWLRQDEVQAGIAAGEMRDALSLASLFMVEAWDKGRISPAELAEDTTGVECQG